jgi:signal transduction histidine kinase
MSTPTSTFQGLAPTPQAARAHAIKNCMSAITMTCTLVERRRSVGTPKVWTTLRSASLRLRDLVAELLADEVSESVAMSLRVQDWCSVERLTASVAERLWSWAESADVSLAVSCGGGELRCDEESLIEGLVNVTANAIEASPPGGIVSVQTCETADRDHVWVVKDSGSGFCQGQQVVTGFRPRSTTAGGWGLGVALAHIAIARHGGVLRIEATPGAGTTVTIWLPREIQAPADSTARR